MSVPAIWTIAAASLSFMMAILSWGFASTGLKGQRWFALVAFSAGGYMITNLFPLLGFTDDTVRSMGRLGLLFVGINVASWQPYVAAQEGEPMSIRARLIARVRSARVGPRCDLQR